MQLNYVASKYFASISYRGMWVHKEKRATMLNVLKLYSLCALLVLGQGSETWIRWQNDVLNHFHLKNDTSSSSGVLLLQTISTVTNGDIVFANAAAVPFRRTNYVGDGMASSNKPSVGAHNTKVGSHVSLEAGWENHLVLSPSHGLAARVKKGAARFERFDLVHPSTAEVSKTIEVASGFSVSCSVSFPGSVLGFGKAASVVWLLDSGAFSCRSRGSSGKVRGMQLNAQEPMAFLDAGSQCVCDSDESDWHDAAAKSPTLMNCAVEGPTAGQAKTPIPYTSLAPRSFSPSLFPCISFRRVSLGDTKPKKRCSLAGLGSGSDSRDWLLSNTQPARVTKKKLKRRIRQLSSIRKRICDLLGIDTEASLEWALAAGHQYLAARTAASQKTGQQEGDMGNAEWWRGWPSGGFPHRTFVGKLKPGSAPSSTAAHNTLHFMHLNGLVAASQTRLLRRGDVPAMICMPGQDGVFEAAPPIVQIYDSGLQRTASANTKLHTSLALCLYRSDPLQFKSPLMLFSAQAMLSFPPGVAFTPVEACLLAIDAHRFEKLSAFAAGSPERQLQECIGVKNELEALTRILVVAEALVFFDERHARDASVSG